MVQDVDCTNENHLVLIIQIAGKGVFALKEYKAGENIIVCLGKYIPHTVEDNSFLEHKYTFNLRNALADGLLMMHEHECNIAMYVNSSYGGQMPANCVALIPRRFKFLLCLRAKRKISVGEELLLYYEF